MFLFSSHASSKIQQWRHTIIDHDHGPCRDRDSVYSHNANFDISSAFMVRLRCVSNYQYSKRTMPESFGVVGLERHARSDGERSSATVVASGARCRMSQARARSLVSARVAQSRRLTCSCWHHGLIASHLVSMLSIVVRKTTKCCQTLCLEGKGCFSSFTPSESFATCEMQG